MKILVFSVYDSKAQAYGTPFFMQSVGTAVRMFSDLVNEPKTTVAAHPEDYTLFQIGEFDDGPGVLSAIEKHVPLGLASGFVRPDLQPKLPFPGAGPDLSQATQKTIDDLKSTAKA